MPPGVLRETGWHLTRLMAQLVPLSLNQLTITCHAWTAMSRTVPATWRCSEALSTGRRVLSLQPEPKWRISARRVMRQVIKLEMTVLDATIIIKLWAVTSIHFNRLQLSRFTIAFNRHMDGQSTLKGTLLPYYFKSEVHHS